MSKITTPTMAKVTVIHGPKASGKTRNAEAFRSHYRCTRVLDSWTQHHCDHPGPARDGDLVLTYETPATIARHFPNARIISIKVALRAAPHAR